MVMTKAVICTCGFNSLLAGSAPVSSTITYSKHIYKTKYTDDYSCLLLASKTMQFLIAILWTLSTDNTSHTSIKHTS